MKSSIDILLPDLEKHLSPWRKQTVEVASKGVPPHISLLYPWKNTPVNAIDIDRLISIVKNMQPLKLSFSRIEKFENGTVYLALDDDVVVANLCSRIFSQFPETRPYNGEFENPTPHLTVAKLQNTADPVRLWSSVNKNLESLFPLVCTVNEIVVMEEDQFGNWCASHKCTLGDV